MGKVSQDFCIRPGDSLRDAIVCINRNEKGIVLVVDGDRRLAGTITDGDIRRWTLAGQPMSSSVGELLRQKSSLAPACPVTVHVGANRSEMLDIMRGKSLRHLPVLDKQDCVVDLVTMEDLLPEPERSLQAVIMAGGKGTRLRPFTEEVPKPMLMVGDRPLMEHIVNQLSSAGIRQVSVATQYLPHKISEHFGNGERFGVDISYVQEDEPLGTAGALGLMAEWKESLLVVNGDVLTQVNYRAMRDFHAEHKADMTVAVSKYEAAVPFGVVDCEGVEVRKLEEKPHYSFLVNAGIYLLEPSVQSFIPSGQRFDMTDLINALLQHNKRVVSFPILEYWLDVGKPVDFERAKNDIRKMEKKP